MQTHIAGRADNERDECVLHEQPFGEGVVLHDLAVLCLLRRVCCGDGLAVKD